MHDDPLAGLAGEVLEVRDQLQPVPVLSVNVDFNDLLERYSEETTWEILGKLKDLLA